MRKFFSIITLIAGVLVTGAARAECTTDQYAVGDSCYSCPANATCDGVNFNCIDGFYRNLAVCSACPPNSTCTSPTDFSCNPGTYLRNGQCNACPNNATCIGGDETFHCNDEWYKYGQTCMSCAGHVCDGEKIKSCGAGWLLYHNEYCTKCYESQYCPAGTTYYICNQGYYKNSNGTCSTCPKQYFCPFNSATHENLYNYCNTDYYKIGPECVACPSDMTCVGTYPGNMENCPAGTFVWPDGRCMPYAVDDGGTYPDNCRDGFWADSTADNGNGDCVPCPENSTCSSATDFSCNLGYFKKNNVCTVCPPNASCNDTDGVLCNAGFYFNNNKCYGCSDHVSYCPGDNTRHDCPPFVLGAINNALPDGWYDISHSSLYNTTDNVSKINKCEYLTITVATPMGKFNCNYVAWDIDTNSYNPMPYTKHWFESGTGYYLTSPSYYTNYYLRSIPCTNGPEFSTYTGPGSPDGNDCPWVCDDGYYRDRDTCAVCPDGMNCLGGTIVCPTGEYPDVNVCRTCTNKPEHSAYSGPGTPAGNDCAFTCDAGYYYDGTACAICEPGYYCPGDNERHACDGNGYSDITGATVCKSCPVATNLNPDDVKGYYHYAPDGGLHTNIRNCYVKFKVPKTINHGTLTAYLCYIDSNLETYGVSSTCQTQYPNVKCDGGYYMNPPNMSNYYLNINGLNNFLENICIPVGEKYYSPDNDWQRYECPGRQTTTGYGVGADQAADCGVIWHIGGQEVRLRSERRTDPRFCVQINDDIFFADMTPVSEGAHGNIRIEVNGIVYSVYNADLQ